MEHGLAKGSSKNEQLGSHYQLYNILLRSRFLPARLNSLPSETACRSSPPDGNMCCPLSAFSHWSTGKKSRWRVRVNFQASSLANVCRIVNFCPLQIRLYANKIVSKILGKNYLNLNCSSFHLCLDEMHYVFALSDSIYKFIKAFTCTEFSFLII